MFDKIYEWGSIMRLFFAVVVVLVFVSVGVGDIYLPGMQPEEAGIEFAKVQQCRMCHSKMKNKDADIYETWQGGMMAQAARDPLYRATLTIANQDVAGVGEFCWRCHTPRGWLEGRSSAADGSLLNTEDMYGVSCDVCHKFIDPLSDEAKQLVKDVPPGYGNAMIVADPANVVRGPYDDSKGAMPHETKQSDFHASGNLCGTCHNISNPLYAKDVKTQEPALFGHVERTFSEWQLSDYAKQGTEGSCQSCHYPQIKGGSKAAKYSSVHRDYFVQHGPVGGSTWVQDATAYLWPDADLSKAALKAGKKKAGELLRTAAELKVSFPDDGTARLRITNLTGHKLPSGYPEGRRMWINVRFLDAGGDVIREIGRYDSKEDTLFGKTVTVPTLLDAGATKVYEVKPAMSEAVAKKHGKKAGPSFHFVLNDTIAKDNRIPPKGFNNAKFAEHLSAPVGAEYADGQYWDDTDYTLPDGCAKVAIKLMYQSASWEYIQFLAEENRTDDWGKRLYDAWENTGKCPPFVIAEIQADLDELGGLR
jgi:hypothetical protein